MSRRRPPRRKDSTQGHFVQHLALRCPVDDAHPLGEVIRDMVKTVVRPAFDHAAGTVNAPEVPLRLDGERLRWICPSCVRQGRRRDDSAVLFARVVAVLDAMKAAKVAHLRVRLDPADLTRHADAKVPPTG